MFFRRFSFAGLLLLQVLGGCARPDERLVSSSALAERREAVTILISIDAFARII